MSCRICLSALVPLLFLVCTADAQEKAKNSDKETSAADKPATSKDTMSAKKPASPAVPKKTHKVEKGPFKVEITLKGILESEAMSEVVVSPEGFTPENRGQLRVLKAIPLGTEVRKGDQLIWFDRERLDQIITDMEKDREFSDLAFKLAQEDLGILEKATPIDLRQAERANKIADEDLKRFLGDDKDFLIKMANYQVKNAHDSLAYAKEELQQLEKMYKASDLTESTEQIILKRQRDQVERSAFYLKLAEYDRDMFFKISLPRREENAKENQIKQSLSLEKTKTTLPLMLNQKKLTVEKMKFDRERTAEKLQKLKKDRETLVVRASSDGIVFYGKSVRGQWSSASVESRLQRGGNLMPDEIIMTIVQPRPLFVRASVEEKDLNDIRDGLKAKVVPTALPDVKLPGRVEKVSTIPVSSGHFEARISLGEFKESLLMPAMACSVKLVPYQKSDALTVPALAVFTEENDEDNHYVYVQSKDEKATKVKVTQGRRSGNVVEILQGLQDGDQILLEKPTPASGVVPTPAKQ
jgi:HlyD family secretion protein